jgi:hypothetical protein
MERFERAVTAVSKSPAQHRVAKKAVKKAKSKKPYWVVSQFEISERRGGILSGQNIVETLYSLH